MPPKAERKPRSFMKTCDSSGPAMRSAQRCRDAQRSGWWHTDTRGVEAALVEWWEGWARDPNLSPPQWC